MSLKALDKFLMQHVLKGSKGANELREYYRTKARTDISKRISEIGDGPIGKQSQETVKRLQRESGDAMGKYLDGPTNLELSDSALARWIKMNGG